jgi:hypothetical protein
MVIIVERMGAFNNLFSLGDSVWLIFRREHNIVNFRNA